MDDSKDNTVRRRLEVLYKEIHGETTKVTGFRDITSGWETRLYAFELKLPNKPIINLIARIYSAESGSKKAVHEFNTIKALLRVGYPVPEVYIYDAGFEQLGSPFIVMERIDGGTLYEAMQKNVDSGKRYWQLFSTLFAPPYIRS